MSNSSDANALITAGVAAILFFAFAPPPPSPCENGQEYDLSVNKVRTKIKGTVKNLRKIDETNS